MSQSSLIVQKSHLNAGCSVVLYLSISSMLFSPCSHDKRIVDRDTCYFLYTFILQFCSLLHKTWEVSLKTKKKKKLIRSADYQCVQALLTVWTHFGTARCKCSRYSEEDSFLPLKQLIHSHLIPWLPLLDLHCRNMFTHLMRGEMTIQNNGDLHFTLLKWAILMCMSLEDIACTAICVTFSLHLHRSAAGWHSGGRGVFLYVRTNDRYKNTPI